jgi:hypothetical protein
MRINMESVTTARAFTGPKNLNSVSLHYFKTDEFTHEIFLLN